MSTLKELTDAVASARVVLANAEDALSTFNCAPENNVFETVDRASDVLESRLLGMASEDCEGAGNCGSEEYTQEFIVDGQHHMATLSVEYNRHDKTYYYIDFHEFSVTTL